MKHEHSKTGALQPTGIIPKGGGIIHRERHAESWYKSLTSKQRQEIDEVFLADIEYSLFYEKTAQLIGQPAFFMWMAANRALLQARIG